MKVVLDINALLVSISRNSKYRLIFDLLLDGKYELIISTDILAEYTEIIELKTNAIIATNIAEMLANLVNVKKVEVYYNWNLIIQDPDDNKYVDAAVSGGCDYVVSNDQHFKVLNQVEFPKVNRITIDEFLEICRTKLK